MAKTKTLRVHNLAKELGVPSKVILEKCRAEGIELKNHMAAIAVGLAASIREWFSEGADVTTIEVAAHVDLDKVKTRPEPEPTPEPEPEPVAEAAPAEPAAEPAVAEQTAQEETVASEAAATEEPQVASEEEAAPVATATDDEEAPISEATLEAPAADAAPEAEPAAESTDTSAPAEETPPAEEPAAPAEPIVPAGPQVVPTPAELKGPKVVRIEAPEPVRTPRPRRPAAGPGPGGGGGMGGPGPMAPGEAPTGDAPRRKRGGGRPQTAADARSHGRSPRRQGNKTEFSERFREWRDQDLIERRERLASATGHGIKARRSAERRRKSSGGGVAPRSEEVEMTFPASIKDFCSALAVPFNTIAQKLMEHTGGLVRITDNIDAETGELVALDLGITLKVTRALTALEGLAAEVEQRERENLQSRPPIVAMLGHVDHGKTSLLDAIRKTNVVKGEAGGITQHIGAYQIKKGKWNVTFLDTPGHEAFTSMRARGADMTDVVVLVVAADDGVMPQTIEAINHAKAAGVQIVVALNKVDLPNVDLNKIYGQLAEHELTPTEWGGETDVVKTSALKGEGVEDLLEHLTTLSELLDLKADPSVPAVGTVIEAQVREGRGNVAQVMVVEGTLKAGQFVTCGPGAGRVRSLSDHRGKRLKEAGPGTPVELLGLDELPDTGDKLYVVKNLNRAKEVAEEIRIERREASLQAIRRKPQSLEELLQAGDESEVPELNLIVKADVQGSLEAVLAKLAEFPDDKVRLRILHHGIGAVTEADIALAEASGAVSVGFNVVTEDRAKRAAEQAGVEIRGYRVIYELLNDVQLALEGLLAPNQVAEDRGKAEVREVFSLRGSKTGRIAGCIVLDGVIQRNHKARLVRDGRIVGEDMTIDSLRRFKDDAREVRAGLECGIKLAGYDDLKPGDVIEAYEIIEVAQKL